MQPTLSPYRRRLWLLTGVAFVVFMLYVGSSFIGTAVVALFLYYGTRPFYRRLLVLLKNRSLAAGAAIILVSLPVILLAGYTATIGYRELNRFLTTFTGDSLEDFLSPFIDTDVLNAVSQIIQSPAQAITEGLSPGLLNDLLQFAFSSLSFAGLLGLHLFLVLVVSFYLLRDGYKLRRWMYAEFQLKNTLGDQYLRAVDHDFHRIFFGNLLNAIVTGLIGAITFSLVNVAAPAGHQIPYPTLLGLLCGVTSLIPVVGMKLVYVPVTSFLIARMVVAGQLTELLWFPALFVAISFVIVDSIPDFVLRPYISGRDLHIGSLMVAYIVGPLFFGWYGLFLGPMVLVLLFHYARTVFPEVHRQPFTEAIASAQKTLSEFTRKEL